MYSFNELVSKEIEEMKELLKISRRTLGKGHVGSLVVRQINGSTYYYESWRAGGKTRQRYLGTAGDERVGQFIIRKVIQKRIELLNKDIKTTFRVKADFSEYSSEAILKLLGKKYEIAFWNASALEELDEVSGESSHSGNTEEQHVEYDHSARPFLRTIITCDGHRVRSKGECIIYDLLVMAHVVFEYEPTIYLYDENFNLIEIHPDFYIECKDGTHIIIEHLGLLNDSEYADSQEWKLRMYHRNGYDLGHNLIMTSDNEKSGIDSGFIADLINGVILKRARTTE